MILIKPNAKRIKGFILFLLAFDLVYILLMCIALKDIVSAFHVLIGLLIAEAILVFSIIAGYKTFSFDGKYIEISSTFFNFLFKRKKVDISQIGEIRIIQWQKNYRESPVFKIYFDNIRKRRIKVVFRMSENEEEFQNLINTLRAKGVSVECEGGIWR